MKSLAILAALAVSILTTSAQLQSLTIGDGELSWKVSQSYSDASSGQPVGYQTYELVFNTDTSGRGIFMSLDQKIISTESGSEVVIKQVHTELVPSGNGVTWRVDLLDGQSWFQQPITSTVPTSVLKWSDHTGTLSASAVFDDPTQNSYVIWLDWTKKKGVLQPRITVGLKPSQFNQFLSDGSHNPNP